MIQISPKELAAIKLEEVEKLLNEKLADDPSVNEILMDVRRCVIKREGNTMGPDTEQYEPMDQHEERASYEAELSRVAPAFFKEMVAGLAKPGQDIINGLTPQTADALHMALGICGEAGELADAVKKWAIYLKDLDRENVVEELGDLEFYMEHIRQLIGITREETIQYNIQKLGKRYEGHIYSDQQAQDRADKK